MLPLFDQIHRSLPALCAVFQPGEACCKEPIMVTKSPSCATMALSEGQTGPVSAQQHRLIENPAIDHDVAIQQPRRETRASYARDRRFCRFQRSVCCASTETVVHYSEHARVALRFWVLGRLVRIPVAWMQAAPPWPVTNGCCCGRLVHLTMSKCKCKRMHLKSAVVEGS